MVGVLYIPSGQSESIPDHGSPGSGDDPAAAGYGGRAVDMAHTSNETAWCRYLTASQKTYLTMAAQVAITPPAGYGGHVVYTAQPI